MLWTYVVNDLNAKDIFTKRNCKKQIKNNLHLKKAMQIKGDKLYVKSKGHTNSFNSWIDKKDSINERIFSKTKIFRSKCKNYRFIKQIL